MPYFEPSIDADGVHVPTYGDVMEYLIEQYKAIFGEDAYLGEETKDYQLLSLFAKCMDDVSTLAIDVYNSRNPNYASGSSLDLLLPLVSMRRRAATYSTVTLKLTGTAGMTIPTGQSVIDTSGILWNLDTGATFDGNGEATVTATCAVAGAISAPIGTINQIYTPVIDWTGVTNEEEAIMGKDVETDEEVRIRRKNMVNSQNNGTSGAIVHAVSSIEVDGNTIDRIEVLINDTNSTDSRGLPAHSICCIVDGLDGSESLIGEAIWKAKSPGVATYGGPAGNNRITVNYVDMFGNNNVVYFARPVIKPVTVTVNITRGSKYDGARCLPIIQNAIMNSINSLEIGQSWGVTLAYRDIYNAFAGEEIPFVITEIKGKTSSMGTASTSEVPCAFNERLSVEETNITINVT